jgi:hypothetical protein
MWMEQLYDLSKSNINEESIHKMFDLVSNELYTDRNKLNEDLANIDLSKLDVHFMVGIARALFPVSEHLANYKNYIERSFVELTSRGENAANELQGLI